MGDRSCLHVASRLVFLQARARTHAVQIRDSGGKKKEEKKKIKCACHGVIRGRLTTVVNNSHTHHYAIEESQSPFNTRQRSFYLFPPKVNCFTIDSKVPAVKRLL